jgi:hypothetical protein
MIPAVVVASAAVTAAAIAIVADSRSNNYCWQQ